MAQGEKNKTMKQNREIRKRLTCIQSEVLKQNANAIQWEMDGLSYYGTESTGYPCGGKMNFDPSFKLYSKINWQ